MTLRPTTLDIVVPLYNEAEGVRRFHEELRRVTLGLPCHVTVYYVDDGSTDDTAATLREIAREDPPVVVIELSRNFGHQAALTAGLDATRGDAVITMDGDGQHPPALIPEMFQLFQHGYDVVLTQRGETSPAGRFKRTSARAFYWLLGRLSHTPILPGSADYRLLSRQVVEALQGMRETHRFLRGMVAWLGYRSVILPYAEQPRLAGVSKYSFRKMLRFAADAVFSFSVVPLQIMIVVGIGFMLMALFEVAYVLQFWLRGEQHRLVAGWSSLMLMVLLVGGVVMLGLGVIGVYVGYIFQEVKRRPIYIVHASRQGESRRTNSKPDQHRP